MGNNKVVVHETCYKSFVKCMMFFQISFEMANKVPVDTHFF